MCHTSREIDVVDLHVFITRELDLRTFSMLKCGLVSRAVLDSNMNTKVRRMWKSTNLHLRIITVS